MATFSRNFFPQPSASNRLGDMAAILSISTSDALDDQLNDLKIFDSSMYQNVPLSLEDNSNILLNRIESPETKIKAAFDQFLNDLS